MSARSCPICGVAVSGSEAPTELPFCSKRCRLLDLDGWLGERYRLADPEPAGAKVPDIPGAQDGPTH